MLIVKFCEIVFANLRISFLIIIFVVNMLIEFEHDFLRELYLTGKTNNKKIVFSHR